MWGSRLRVSGLGSDVGDVAEVGALRAQELADYREPGVCVVELDEHLKVFRGLKCEAVPRRARI